MQQFVDLSNVCNIGCRPDHAVHQTRFLIDTNVSLQSGKAGVLLPPLRTVLESHPSYGSSLPAA